MSDLVAEISRRLYNCHDQSPSFVGRRRRGGRSVFLVRHSRSIQPLISRREARAVRRSRPTQSIKKTADLLGDARPLLLPPLPLLSSPSLSLFVPLFAPRVLFRFSAGCLSDEIREIEGGVPRRKLGDEKDAELIEGKRILRYFVEKKKKRFISELISNLSF